MSEPTAAATTVATKSIKAKPKNLMECTPSPGLPQIILDNIKHIIGSGSHGSVFEMNDGTVIKAMHTFHASEIFTPECAVSEINALTRLEARNIPHVVRILSTYTVNDYIVIQMKKYKPLRTELQNNWNTDFRFKIIRQLVKTIGAINFADVIHYDIKLDNLLLDENKDLVVIDFSLSNIGTGGERPYEEVYTETHRGPELLLYGDYNSYKSETWALAVTILEILFMDFPFRPRYTLNDIIREYGYIGGLDTYKHWNTFMTKTCTYIPQYSNLLTRVARVYGDDVQEFISSLMSHPPWKRPTTMDAVFFPFINETLPTDQKYIDSVNIALSKDLYSVIPHVSLKCMSVIKYIMEKLYRPGDDDLNNKEIIYALAYLYCIRFQRRVSIAVSSNTTPATVLSLSVNDIVRKAISKKIYFDEI